MLQATLLAAHVASAMIWVGGMFYAHQVLRPAALKLDPPQRLTLWRDNFGRFFPWVWGSVTVLLASGYAMLFARFGGFAGTGVYVHIMQLLGLIMTGIFLFVFFAPYGRLKKEVANENWQAAGQQLARIRRLVGMNLTIGLVTIVIASGGRLW